MVQTLKVIVGGVGNVGKTSLIFQYTKRKFSEARNLTYGIDITTHPMTVAGESIKLAIFDIEGSEGNRSGFYLGARAAMLVYDVMDPRSFEALPEWIERYRKYCLNAPLMIVGNKLDLGQRVPLHWTAALARYAHAQQYGCVSAKTNTGVDWAFETLAALAVHHAATLGPIWHPVSKALHGDEIAASQH